MALLQIFLAILHSKENPLVWEYQPYSPPRKRDGAGGDYSINSYLVVLHNAPLFSYYADHCSVGLVGHVAVTGGLTAIDRSALR